MAEEKEITPVETPESVETDEKADGQVAETEGSEEAETPAVTTSPEADKVDEPQVAAPQEDAVSEEVASDEKAPEAEAAPDAQAARRTRRGGVSVGIAHIRATFNNTLVSISDMRGGVISWSSAGRAGFKGSRKSTAFAATTVAQDAARQAISKGMHEVEVHVQGAGSGRESAIRALQTSGLVVTLIKDVTPMPHNGCRQRKRRRV